MALRTGAVAALLLALSTTLLTSCSGGAAEPPTDAAAGLDDDLTSPSPTRVAEPDGVVEFSPATRGCSDLDPGVYRSYVTFRAEAPITLTGGGLVGARGVTVTRAWVADVRGDVQGTGILDMSELPDDYEGVLRWGTREAVVGRQVEAGTLQAFVIDLKVRGDGGYKAWELSYERDGEPATAVFEESLRIPCRRG